MPSQPAFLGLPRELRDEMYDHYFRVEDGYSFNPRSGKLTSFDGQPLNLSLRFVCRRIAAETYDLALKRNAIHFYTGPYGATRERAGHFDTLMRMISSHQKDELYGTAAAFGCFDQQVHHFVSQHFPQYSHTVPNNTLRHISGIILHNIITIGNAPSEDRHFIGSVLDMISTRFSFEKDASLDPKFPNIIACHFDPWAIPSVDDIATLKHKVPSWPINANRIDPSTYWNNLEYRFSAAAAAIHFLQNTVESVRTRIRKIIFHEDHIAVAWPECHAQGLIPFCQQSPGLKIERRVNLWRNALHGGTDPLYILREQSPQIIRRERADCLRAEDVTRASRHG
jgi:hypothetical protein